MRVPCVIIYIGISDRFLAHYRFIRYGYKSVYRPPIRYISVYRYTSI